MLIKYIVLVASIKPQICNIHIQQNKKVQSCCFYLFPLEMEREEGSGWTYEFNKLWGAMISSGSTFARESTERRMKVGGIANDREEVGLAGMLRALEELGLSHNSMFIFKAIRKQKSPSFFLYNQCPLSGLNEILLCPASSPFLGALVLAI